MKNAVIFVMILTVALLSLQCSQNSHLIAKEKVGSITKKTTEKDIYKLFESDSIVTDTVTPLSSLDEKIFKIFKKNGKKQLEITFAKRDSVFSINNVQLFSEEYKTKKGISVQSNFNDVHKNYTISNVEATFSSIILFINELNVTISIDKSQAGIGQFSLEKVKLEQIPDATKIKYFTVWFN